ncbi:hypothetical protein [Polaribacter butkevichii]|uniref:DUF4412 domain-containing protein n=1 Tax=Polaribacter butkevichii TaxID=218490 RepID=A0A2P6CAK6_9FLAO|nr:hypothetical protein [Polaribacter butkevichii]PQJ71935.1 hypothetical protein BTO14_01110 [Polaribacter butkevichii]
MKNLSILIAILTVTISCNRNSTKSADNLSIKTEQQALKLKRYEVESGIIKYKITINGSVLGSEILGSGIASLYFKDWGNLELVEEESTRTTNTTVFHKKNTDIVATHTMSKLNNGESYSVDFNRKQIFLKRDMAMELHKKFVNGDVNKVGVKMLEGIGGKLVGNEKFLGYNCEAWNIHGAKQLMYKGVVLRLEMTMMGVKTVKEATNIQINTRVDDSHFKLPNFPIIKEEGFMDNEEYEDEVENMDAKMIKLSKMSFKEWKKMALADKDNEDIQQMSNQELRQTYNMMQKVIKMQQEK